MTVKIKDDNNKNSFTSKPFLNNSNNGSPLLFGVFGGQGNVEDYFNELEIIYTQNADLIRPFVEQMTQALNSLVASHEHATTIHTKGLDVLNWLDSKDNNLKPSSEYLLAAPVSLPLIGLVQLTHYYLLMKKLDINEPRELLMRFSMGMTGHSQGIISAYCISSSNTMEDFMTNSKQCLSLLFFIGISAYNIYPKTSIEPNILQDSIKHNEGTPSMMVAIYNLDIKKIKHIVENTNKHLLKNRQIYIGLVNGPKFIVCVGHPKSLYGLNLSLRRIKASSEIDQTRVPFSKRKLVFSNKYLPITAPFHTPYLNNVKEMVLKDLEKYGIKIENKMHVPVYSTYDGHNLQTESSSQIAECLIDMICTLPLNFERALQTNESNHNVYIADFGPGGSSGIGYIINKNKLGTGTKVILASVEDGLNKDFIYQTDLVSIIKNQQIFKTKNWQLEYTPKLVRINNSNNIMIDTKMSRLLGKPPLMVAGMTPCTVNDEIISAVMNAGYHIELAGGGQHTENILRQNLLKIFKNIKPGDSVTVNLLFLNARLWAFQFPLLVKMRLEGYSIDGICIAAGVPSLEVANDCLKQMKEAGMKHVAFKPGSVQAIYQIIQIANMNKDFPIIMQWTGGRAGGHHSFEDVHQPILDTYAKIRECDNIVLIVGSGFGDAEDTYPYLNGTWSLRFGYPHMPFDGVLFGSRMMVCKECKASLQTKQAIVNAPGISDDEWEKSYDKEIGGVITVKSELGEPIHKIATRGVRLWSEFDRTIFSLPKEKRIQVIEEKKDYIIDRLNKDFQKVWFAQKSNRVPCLLEEMTYAEVLNRLIELLYIPKQNRWLDVTLRNLVGDFIIRTEERFVDRQKSSFLENYNVLDNNPNTVLNEFTKQYPKVYDILLATQDIQYFIMLCMNPVMKPVPFIPILDENFEFWFKKDSLWQSEDLDAVPEQDVQRCCILQGPVAAKYSTKINEPAKEILDNINNKLITKLKSDGCQIQDIEYIPFIQLEHKNSISTKDIATSYQDILLEENKYTTTFRIGNNPINLPSVSEFCNVLAGNKPSWLRACLTSPTIVSNKKKIENFMPKIFRPRKQQIIKVYKNNKHEFESIDIYDIVQDNKNELRVTLSKQPNSNIIDLHMYEFVNNKPIKLNLKYVYNCDTSYALIHEVTENKNENIKQFYAQLWDCPIHKTLKGVDDNLAYEYKINKQEVLQFCQAVNNTSEFYIVNNNQQKDNINVPIDYSIVIAWKALTNTLFDKRVDGDLLKLVHLSNEFKALDNKGLKSDDIVTVTSDIHSIMNTKAGKQIKVSAYIYKDNVPKVEVVSAFLIRGNFSSYENTFEKGKQSVYSMQVSNIEQIAIIKSKNWLEWTTTENKEKIKLNSILLFKLNYENYYKSSDLFSLIKTTGTVLLQQSTKDFVEIAKIKYEATDTHGNPVYGFLSRYAKQIKEKKLFEDGGYSVIPSFKEFNTKVSVPATNFAYSKVSFDYNPIHTNIYFAELASLSSVITHGMWTSASIKGIIETFAAENNPSRIKMYHIDFQDMVFSNDVIQVKAYHIGMKSGRKLIKIKALNQRNICIAEGLCEIEQPYTAYVFTGQGSQEKNMGMNLYESSSVAQKIWDSADLHFVNNYGFSILKIVRDNPMEITVYFGGEKGREIKSNYMKMTYEIVDNLTNQLQTLPLFPEITDECDHYTFRSNKGLLSATQFTQPALTLMELASFEDMRSKGLIQTECSFAGHSLGEYAALASIGNMMPIESLVDLVFYRGMTMQTAVKRDSLGRSNYGMIAVNPTRVGLGFSEELLSHIIRIIAKISNKLIEIVNYNVENWQYVVSGNLTNLHVLGIVLDYIKTNFDKMSTMIKNSLLNELDDLVNSLIASNLNNLSKDPENEYLILNKTNATVPLAGIDVPFHSSFLTSGVGPFRFYLTKRIDRSYVDVKKLINNYIPNLTARPFSLEKEYIEYIYQLTKSQPLKQLLENNGLGYEARNMNDPEEQQLVAYILVIELLSYQFASPVRWIETQDVLFKDKGIERLIEIGPSPILCGMANRTLKFKYEEYDDALTFKRVALCYAKDFEDIYYLQRENTNETEQIINEKIDRNDTKTEVVNTKPQQQSFQPTTSNNSALIVDTNINLQDEAMPITDYVHIIIAQKLNRNLDQVPITKSIKDLSGGKSTLQNEILGDIGKEFDGNIVEKAEEMPLQALAEAVKPFYTGQLGKYTSTLVNKMISSKMPAGFNYSSVKKMLSSDYKLGPLRIDAVLMQCLMNEPKQRFADEKTATTWIQDIVKHYSSKYNINLFASKAGAGANSQSNLNIDPEALKKLNYKQDLLFQRQYSALCEYFEKSDVLALNDEYKESKMVEEYVKELNQLNMEMGEDFVKNIQPLFDYNKARHYNSYWNWSRQDALLLYYEIIFGKLTTVDRDITQKCINIINRADQALLDFMKYNIFKCDESKGEFYKLAKEFGTELIQNVEQNINAKPKYKDVRCPLAPQTIINEEGNVIYNEVKRKDINKLSQFVDEMRNGSILTRNTTTKINNDVNRLIKAMQKNDNKPSVETQEAFNKFVDSIKSFNNTNKKENTNNENVVPILSLKSRFLNKWNYDSEMSETYLNALSSITKNGVSFYNKKVLLTGCGRNSIGSDILKGLLCGGAHVVVTTSRFNRQTKDYYQDLYHTYGAKDSYLVVLPFNQGSKSDIQNLISYIYNKQNGLGWDLDFVIPFAAVPENGREINNIDSFSEFSHRLMLLNVMRILGMITDQKQQLNIKTRPAHVVLPLSPNHGVFGEDGLYSESKMGLENIMNRWYSENWRDYINVIGASIGWTRSTGLMQQNNIVSDQVEKYGVRTFSTQEMAFSILGLLHPNIIALSQKEPVWADLGGGLDCIKDFKSIVSNIRKQIMESSSIKKAINSENNLDMLIVNPNYISSNNKSIVVQPRAKFNFEFPELDNFDYYQSINKNSLKGMLDLENIVVVTGFSEVGPFGNARTRWEIEKNGEFSIEGCIEMAWMMGFIKNFNGMLSNGKKYSGWIDTETKMPVNDFEVKHKYEDKIMKHTGIRLIESELFDGYDPNNRNVLREVLITKDMDPLEVSKEEAIYFKNKHKDKVVVFEKEDVWFVQFLKGCAIFVPKALQASRLVAGQIPTGWDASRYGISQDIVDQVDKITLYVLVSTVEALVSSGITDPYEFYKYVHISQIGNTIGSGMGGMRSLRKMYKDRFTDKQVQQDILQETFINTMPAWINLLILSGCGPIKTPVGACATAVESVEIGVDTIMSKKAKVCIVGGYDDFHEEGSTEFANMNATSNSLEEFKKGREPNEMSRPTTSSRAGFMESQGAGVQILMNAKLAIEMGVPIYAIVALTNTAMDKEGRSVPAPGQGILSTAKQVNLNLQKPFDIMDIEYRKQQIETRKQQIKVTLELQYKQLNETITKLKEENYFETNLQEKEYFESAKRYIDQKAEKEESNVLNLWGNQFYTNDPFIAPIKGALAVYGLSIDDIGVASFHGTGTKANDTNETEVVNKQFEHLNRTKGNACPSIFQKYLTGHPKGAAAAWMLNGVIQSLNSGIIPGNRNADNIDDKLKQYEFVVFPSKTIKTDGIKAGILKSFGFGQVGGEVLVIHRDYLFNALSKDQFEKYRNLNKNRYNKAYRYMHDSITNNKNLVRVKNSPPYTKNNESSVYLDPLARAKFNTKSKQYEIEPNEYNAQNINSFFQGNETNDMNNLFVDLNKLNKLNKQKGVGIDVQLISDINVENITFIKNNFTNKEIEYCMGKPDPQASFCGKWAAKEAFIKAISSYNLNLENKWTKGVGAPLKDIEIVSGPTNAPIVNIISEEVKKIVKEVGCKEFKISISHSGNYAVAICLSI